jgi:hypothetical protein
VPPTLPERWAGIPFCGPVLNYGQPEMNGKRIVLYNSLILVGCCDLKKIDNSDPVMVTNFNSQNEKKRLFFFEPTFFQ